MSRSLINLVLFSFMTACTHSLSPAQQKALTTTIHKHALAPKMRILAEKGDRDAQFWMGDYIEWYAEEPSAERAIPYYRDAAIAGHLQAQKNYFNKLESIFRNYRLSFFWRHVVALRHLKSDIVFGPSSYSLTYWAMRKKFELTQAEKEVLEQIKAAENLITVEVSEIIRRNDW